MNSTCSDLPATEEALTDCQIDAVCDRFEAEWTAGQRPQIEDYLNGWNEPQRSKLLQELMLLELYYRDKQGEQPACQEYQCRFGKHKEIVADAFHRWSSCENDTTRLSDKTLVMRSELGKLQFQTNGGLGLIYLAEDQHLGRAMAVKLIGSRSSLDPASQKRFLLEAEITSRLEHPGVVPVYGLGQTTNGRPFYAMRFIQGETLDEAIRRFHQCVEREPSFRSRRNVEFRALLSRFVAVCKTVAYAHNRGVIHRDIKPENVMLGRYGETIVIDWGLAMPVGRQGVFKENGEKTLMPGSGSQSSDNSGGAAGTPAYMSPEQALGTLDLTPSSDIYSLGATLYKIITGRSPFRGRAQKIQRQVIVGEFKQPSDLKQRKSLPHVGDVVVRRLRDAKKHWKTRIRPGNSIGNLLSDSYRDPLAEYERGRWLAAFAPVLVSARSPDASDTGWFVIVQQRQ